MRAVRGNPGHRILGRVRTLNKRIDGTPEDAG
jgi:hypothetical protein